MCQFKVTWKWPDIFLGKFRSTKLKIAIRIRTLRGQIRLLPLFQAQSIRFSNLIRKELSRARSFRVCFHAWGPSYLVCEARKSSRAFILIIYDYIWHIIETYMYLVQSIGASNPNLSFSNFSHLSFRINGSIKTRTRAWVQIS